MRSSASRRACFDGTISRHEQGSTLELIRFTDLECHYGAREIFNGLSGVFASGERIGLVGPNGAGKSSLLRMLAGVTTPFGGTIVRSRDAKLGYLAQNVADETQATIQDLIDGALARVDHSEWGLRNKTLRIMLATFGFSADHFDRPLRTFSGGQRAKAALAHVLIDDPDYFIFDEPTNHLDIATVRWLEDFFREDKRGFLIVSHDRYFLDRVATRIWEIEAGKLHVYLPAQPAYASYVEQRDERHAIERREYATYLAERDKRRATIAGLRATHTSSDYAQVRSREKKLAQLEARTTPPPPVKGVAQIAVRLEATRGAANAFAFEIDGLAKAYAHALFSGLEVSVQRGERLAVVGPNGAGKSTFLKILSGELAPDSGTIRFNPAAKLAYFAQNSHEQLDVTRSATQAVLAHAPISVEAAKAMLGRMRISGDDSDKPVSAFSGGERRRIMLACLMAKSADILLLDEPTNDLDIESREALEDVLSDFEGAIVAVSHDRYLLARVADRVLWIEDGAWGIVDGNYDAYETQQRKREREAIERVVAPAKAKSKSSQSTPLKIRSQLETHIARAEREIAKVDARKREIDELFMEPELYTDRARVAALTAERDALMHTSAAKTTEWEHLVHQLEALQ